MFRYFIYKLIRFVEILMSVILCLTVIWLGEVFSLYRIVDIIHDYPITLPIIGGVLTSYILPLVKTILQETIHPCDCEKRRKI